MPNPFAHNSLLNERVRHAVDRVLALPGLPDLRGGSRLSAPLLRGAGRTAPRSAPAAGAGYYRGYYGGYYGGVSGSTSYDYEQGTLMIDFIDARTGRLAWRGWAVGANRQGYYDEAQVDASVDEILARFPPGRAQ